MFVIAQDSAGRGPGLGRVGMAHSVPCDVCQDQSNPGSSFIAGAWAGEVWTAGVAWTQCLCVVPMAARAETPGILSSGAASLRAWHYSTPTPSQITGAKPPGSSGGWSWQSICLATFCGLIRITVASPDTTWCGREGTEQDCELYMGAVAHGVSLETSHHLSMSLSDDDG